MHLLNTKTLLPQLTVPLPKQQQEVTTPFTPLTGFMLLTIRHLSLMSLGNTAKAIPLLNNALEQSPAETLRIKAQWYLSLAYLKEEKIPDAAETLQLLINNPLPVHTKTKQKNYSLQ
jgi:hypothetical protein